MPGEPDASPRPGSVLLAEVQQAAHGTDLAVKGVECLGNCKRRLSAAMLRDGCWSYVFGDLTPDSGADLIAGAKLFATSTDGHSCRGAAAPTASSAAWSRAFLLSTP